MDDVHVTEPPLGLFGVELYNLDKPYTVCTQTAPHPRKSSEAKSLVVFPALQRSPSSVNPSEAGL